jgi:hypothetical protein
MVYDENMRRLGCLADLQEWTSAASSLDAVFRRAVSSSGETAAISLVQPDRSG